MQEMDIYGVSFDLVGKQPIVLLKTKDGTEIDVDSRPSDAIALAIRAEAPIFAADSVIEESAIEFEGEEVNEEEIVDEFKRFLDDVSPDQFAVGDEEN